MSTEKVVTEEKNPFAEDLSDLADVSEDQSAESGFEVPRPALTLREAAAIMGKSLRSLERSILGKWGNKLPDGWSAKKVDGDTGQEWRILPPPGFRLKFFSDSKESVNESGEKPGLEKTSSAKGRRNLPFALSGQTLDSPAIVIDRTDEVENLLRELIQVQRQLSEERRLRMEDLRLITQMQSSMRLLESNANETQRLKETLTETKKEFLELKDEYIALVNAPWWKRLFRGKR